MLCILTELLKEQTFSETCKRDFVGVRFPPRCANTAWLQGISKAATCKVSMRQWLSVIKQFLFQKTCDALDYEQKHKYNDTGGRTLFRSHFRADTLVRLIEEDWHAYSNCILTKDQIYLQNLLLSDHFLLRILLKFMIKIFLCGR